MSTTESNLEIASPDQWLAVADGGMWTRQAPRSLTRRYRTIDEPAGWQAWGKHLARRRKPVGLGELLPGRRWPLAWVLPAEPVGSATADLIERLGDLEHGSRSAAEADWAAEVENWIWSCEAAVRSVPWALETLAWTRALPHLAQGPLEARLWWRLLGTLIALASQGDRIDVLNQPLENQLLAGELALTLAYLFPELEACRQLRAPARAALARGLAELLDGEGLPQGALLPIMRPLWACWIRCRAIGGKATWDRESEKQFRRLALEAVRLSRTDGTQVLSAGEAGAAEPKLFELARRLVDSKSLDRASARMLPAKRRRGAADGNIKPSPAVNSEWSEIAVLQPAWRTGGPKLSLVYAERQVQIELEYCRELIFSGSWELEVRLDGAPLEITANWEEVCWMSDKDVDYVEIQARLSAGVVVQRQIMLARQDRCLLLADAVVGSQPGRLEYRSALPLNAKIKLEPAAESREVWLAGRRARLVALPLALPEWRIDPRHGDYAPDDGKLCLRQAVDARSLYAPTLLDLDARRRPGRHLAPVDGRRVAADSAVGRGGRLPRSVRRRAVAAVSFAGRDRNSHRAGAESVHRILVRPVPPQRRSQADDRNRVTPR